MNWFVFTTSLDHNYGPIHIQQIKAVKYMSSLTTVETSRNSSQELDSLVLLWLASGCNKASREPYILATQSVIFFDDWHPVSLHFLSLFARQLLLLQLNTTNLPWILFFLPMCICTETVTGSILIFSISKTNKGENDVSCEATNMCQPCKVCWRYTTGKENIMC